MENFLVRLRQFICCFFLLFIGKASVAQNVCPPNIDFGFGDFTNWQCYAGNVTLSGTTNVVNVSPSAPLPNRHTVINPTGLTDQFGGFPMTPDANPVVSPITIWRCNSSGGAARTKFCS